MASDLREPIRFLQLENARLTEENHDLREEIETLRQVLDAMIVLQDISTSISSKTNILGLLDRILESALKAINATGGSLILIDEDTGELVFTVVHGSAREALLNYRLPRGTGIAGWVAQHFEPVIIPNARLDPRFSSTVDNLFHFETRTMMCVPIATSNRMLGVITALNKNNNREFTPTDLALFAVVAQLAATAMERAEHVTTEPK
jgi:GAF domain-containing protein